MESINLKADLNILLSALKKVGDRISRDFYEIEKLQVSRKGVADFVTNSDLKAEKILVKNLAEARPEYGFLTEESGEIAPIEENQKQQDAYTWVIDPIDGTFNFMHAIPFFSTSVALVKNFKSDDEDTILSAVCNPIANEVFWAIKGSGAYMTDSLGQRKKLKISKNIEYEKVLCAVHDHTYFSGLLKSHMDYVRNKKGNIRAFGSTALEMAYVADGRINILMHGKVMPWDFLGGLLLVKEAGGEVKNLENNNLTTLNIDGIISGNNFIVENILKHCKKGV